jgi:hypothetical protein
MMRIAKQTEKQQSQIQRVHSEPVSGQGDWTIESCDAEFNYLRVRTTDPGSCTDADVVDVTSIDAVTEKFLTGGGSVIRPKLLIPGVGTLISCSDSVGQVFTFLEEKSPVNPEKLSF